MHFEWDPKKREQTGASMVSLLKRHPAHCEVTTHDPDHSENEERFVTFGLSSKGRLLTVAHTDRSSAVRIISARLATNSERQIYEEG